MFDPGMLPTGRPSRIPRLIALEPITDRQKRVNEILARQQPQPPVERRLITNLHPKPRAMYDDTPNRLPENVARQLARLIAHVNRPGSVPYADVGAAADLVADYFDLHNIPL